ncbi:MAG: hypothetical protein ACTHKM_01605 [Tsuneonella sp.]
MSATSAYAREALAVEFLPSSDQTIDWQDGIQIITEFTDHSMVKAANVRDSLPGKQTTFRVVVASDEAIIFGPEDIWLEYGNSQRLAAVPYDELAGRLRRDIKRRQALAALGGAMSAGSANGYTSGSVAYSGTTSNGTMYSGTGTYSGYDPALAQQQRSAANAQANATARAIQTRQLQGAQALEGMLKRTTAKPLQMVGGIVAVDPPRDLKPGSEVTIVIRVGDQERRLKAKLSK